MVWVRDFGWWSAAEPLWRVACNWCRVDADGCSFFLRFEISDNFSHDDRVIQVSVVEVHIGKEIIIQRPQKRGHIRFVPSCVFEEDHGPRDGSVRKVVEINRRCVSSLALCQETLGGSRAQGPFPNNIHELKIRARAIPAGTAAAITRQPEPYLR
jgi:hypothetical protein